MAEITIKGYYGADYEAMTNDIQSLWGFAGILKESGGTRIIINDYSFLYVSDRGGNYPPAVQFYRTSESGLMQIGNTFISSAWGGDFAGMLAIRTNSATLLSFATNTQDLRAFPQECIILSDAEHHKQGVVKPVASMFKEESSGYSHYICADDSSNAAIAFSPSSYYSRSVTYNADITVLEPFVDTRTTTSLRGVYTLATSQMPNDFIGECTLNGRSYYSYNRILIEDN